MKQTVKTTMQSLYKKAEDVLFKKLPSYIGTPLAILAVIAPVILIAYAYFMGKASLHPSNYTVMITNISGNGGGSGVVVENSPSESLVLTNKHVCEGALKKGGKIRLVNGDEHLVTGYVTDSNHDLCLLSVGADLKNSIKVASKAPEVYSKATITGHPALMPNVITTGHFGGRQIIELMTGLRKCRPSDAKDPLNSFFCSFIGFALIIERYESQIVTATIMAGSSGSAVLNEDGELSGLVFAGNAKGLSYAYIVPYEPLKKFLDSSSNYLEAPWKVQDSEEENLLEESLNLKESKEIIVEKCLKNKKEDIRALEFCNKSLEDVRF